MASELWVCNLGRIAYRQALLLQERLGKARQEDLIPDTLLLLEHDPSVYTREHEVAYHGPGQLVGYPIVRVGEVPECVQLLGRAIVSALSGEGIEAHAHPDDGSAHAHPDDGSAHADPDDGSAHAGIWVGEREIAAIDGRVAHGVAMHRLTVNVDNDLEPFDRVLAGGAPSVRMTSIVAEERRGAGGTLTARPRAATATPAASAEPPAAPVPVAATPAVAVWARPVAACASARVVCFRKRLAFTLAQALGERQRLVTRGRLERALWGDSSVNSPARSLR